MKQISYMRAIQKSWLVIVLASVVFGFVAYVAAGQIPTTYRTHFSYVISLQQREAPQEYTFDGFYAIQATDLFAATLAKWITAPELVVAAFDDAGIDLPSQNPRDIGRRVLAEKTAPQLVQVTVRGTTVDEAEDVAAGIQNVVSANISQYEAEGIPELLFAASATDTWTSAEKPNPTLIVTVVVVLVLVLGINIVLLLTALDRAR